MWLFGCWHSWEKWGEPQAFDVIQVWIHAGVQREDTGVETRQVRKCQKCGAQEVRVVLSAFR